MSFKDKRNAEKESIAPIATQQETNHKVEAKSEDKYELGCKVINNRATYLTIKEVYDSLSPTERNEGTIVDGIKAIMEAYYNRTEGNITPEQLEKLPSSIRYSGDIKLIRSTIKELGL